MIPFRPAALATLRRWAEPAVAGLGVLAGVWLMVLGGWILWPIGAALAALAAGWALTATRRARFQGDPAAPGIVEVDEGRLRYLHPRMGGEVSLNDLDELRLITVRGRRVWRLSDLSGRALLVPLDAAGAGGLFDAFAALPGLTSHALVQALAAETAPTPGNLPAIPLHQTTVWRRQGSGLRAV